jgi:hypothetical protein
MQTQATLFRPASLAKPAGGDSSHVGVLLHLAASVAKPRVTGKTRSAK